MIGPRKTGALLLAAGLTALGLGCRTTAGLRQFSEWPVGASPSEIGKRVAENFAARKLDYQTNPRRQYVIYPEVGAWYGSLTLAQLIRDKELENKLVQKFEPLLTTDSGRIGPDAHVDYRVFGAVPLEIYMITRDRRYLDLGRDLADKQWQDPSANGITREARYWIDDMYMITAVQVQAFRATGDAKYLDRAALTMADYLDKLQKDNGLFYHGTDSHFFWGRGNGWVAAGMAELLRALPRTHPGRARVLQGYTKMMEALLKTQGQDGMWRQLLDKPESWPESSSTGMFAFAMVTGVKNGWLDAGPYGVAARKAWLGLVRHLDKEGNISDVCVGTNKGDTLEYYLARPRAVGDLHGQMPMLWTASALLR
jgi:unsaturated rhamnogalacturonyl hydrolase